MRSVVPTGPGAAGRGDVDTPAGAGDRRGVLPVHHRPDDPVAGDTGPAGRDVVAAHVAAAGGPAAADLGQRGRDRPPGRLAEGVSGFTGALGSRIVQLKPFDPESKGVVERANGYLETSFLPGRVFTSPGDFNEQLARWLPRANSRLVRSLHERPQDRIGADRAGMLGLPPIPPPVGWSQRVRLGRDYYVSVAGSDYSVDPTVIGQLVSVHADLDTVVVTVPGRRVATHPRSWTSATTVTDPVHVEQAARLRKVFQAPRPAAADDLVRDLADYDRAFGVQVGADQPAQVAS